MLSVITLNVIMLNVIMLNVIMLSVAFNLLCWMSLCWVSLFWVSWRLKIQHKIVLISFANTIQGDQIGWFFVQLGYFWKLIAIVLKDEVAQRNGNIFGYFVLKRKFSIFT